MSVDVRCVTPQETSYNTKTPAVHKIGNVPSITNEVIFVRVIHRKNSISRRMYLLTNIDAHVAAARLQSRRAAATHNSRSASNRWSNT